MLYVFLRLNDVAAAASMVAKGQGSVPVLLQKAPLSRGGHHGFGFFFLLIL